MNRIFGNSKPKAPPPNLTDCIGSVSLTLKQLFKPLKKVNKNGGPLLAKVWANFYDKTIFVVKVIIQRVELAKQRTFLCWRLKKHSQKAVDEKLYILVVLLDSKCRSHINVFIVKTASVCLAPKSASCDYWKESKRENRVKCMIQSAQSQASTSHTGFYLRSY